MADTVGGFSPVGGQKGQGVLVTPGGTVVGSAAIPPGSGRGRSYSIGPSGIRGAEHTVGGFSSVTGQEQLVTPGGEVKAVITSRRTPTQTELRDPDFQRQIGEKTDLLKKAPTETQAAFRERQRRLGEGLLDDPRYRSGLELQELRTPDEPIKKEPSGVLKKPTVEQRIRARLRRTLNREGQAVQLGTPPPPVEVLKDFATTVPETVGAILTKGARELGVRPVRLDVTEVSPITVSSPKTTSVIDTGVGERVMFEGATGVVSPERKTVSVLGPEAVGQVGKAALFVTPLAIPILASSTLQQIDVVKQKVPTVNELIEQQTVELSDSERKAYLKTEEGQQYRKEIIQHVDSLRQQKKAAVKSALISGGLLAAPAVVGGARFLGGRVVTPGVRPQPIPLRSQVVVFRQGEEAAGIKVGGTFTPEWLGTRDTRIAPASRFVGDVLEQGAPPPLNLLGVALKRSGEKAKRTVVIAPARRDVTGVPFMLDDTRGVGFPVTKRVGEKTTLEKYFQTAEVSKPTLVSDLSTLPPVGRFISRGLPPKMLKESDKSFFGVSREFLGRPTDVPGIREVRASSGGREFVLPLKPLPSVFDLSFTRVRPVKTPKTEQSTFQFFITEQVTKRTKSFRPRARGQLTREEADVVVIDLPPAKAKTEFFTGKPRQITQKETQELVARAVQTAPKVPSPRPRKPKITPTPISPVQVSGTRPGGLFVNTRTVNVVTTPSSTVRTRTKTRQRLVVTTSPVLGVGSRTRAVTRDALTPKVVSQVRTTQGIIPRVSASVRVALRLAQPTRTRTQPEIFLTTAPSRPFTRPPRRPNIIRRPSVIIPKPEEDPIRKIFTRPKKQSKVTPFIRRGGVFFPITTKPVSPKKARQKGIAALRQSLAASLQLRKPSGELVPFVKETKEFRFGRRDAATLVQRAPKRLSGRGEVLEIVRARKGGYKFI